MHKHLKTVNNFEFSYYITTWICHFFPPLLFPVVTAGTEWKELEKAELRQIKGSVCWDKRWYHVETNYRGAVSKCVEAITATQQPHQQGCSEPPAHARCMQSRARSQRCHSGHTQRQLPGSSGDSYQATCRPCCCGTETAAQELIGSDR